MAVTPPDGWIIFDDPAYTYKDSWADTLKDVLEKRYNLSHIEPIWTCAPKDSPTQFIVKAQESNKTQLYYLWHVANDKAYQFVATILENIKNEMVIGRVTLKEAKEVEPLE